MAATPTPRLPVVEAPYVAKTVAVGEVEHAYAANRLSAAIVRAEQRLGAPIPMGTQADVVTLLSVRHGTDGKHRQIVDCEAGKTLYLEAQQLPIGVGVVGTAFYSGAPLAAVPLGSGFFDTSGAKLVFLVHTAMKAMAGDGALLVDFKLPYLASGVWRTDLRMKLSANANVTPNASTILLNLCAGQYQ